MSLKSLLVLLSNIICVLSLQNGYHEILKNVNQLPKAVKYIDSSIGKVKHMHAVDTLSRTADFVMLKDILFDDSFLESNSNISELCLNQSRTLLTAVVGRQTWALKMLDASSKPPPGLVDGNIQWLGSYDECVAIHSNLTGMIGDIQPYKGEYCQLSVPLPVNGMPGLLNPAGGSVSLGLGLCVPSGCSGSDIVHLVNSVLTQIPNNTIKVSTAVCQEPDRQFDTRAIVVLVVVSLFMVVMVLATIYDVLCIQWPKSQVQTLSGIMNGEIRENYDHKIISDEDTPLLAEKTHVEYKPGIPGKILLSFSIYTNGAKILSTHQTAGSLTAVNGIRFISMSWVILGHTFAFLIGNADNAMTYAAEVFKRWSFMAILNALVSVDTFFTLSGLLLTYLIMKELKRKEGKINWAVFYFHRFWRLTPPYMLILMTYVSLFPYTGSGPLWKKDGMEVNYCKNAWYFNFFYINNFASMKDASEQCMAWAWYLANDMQFFIISPLLIIPLFYSKIIGCFVLFVFLLASWVTTGVISSAYDLGVSLVVGDYITYFDHYYIKPYCRIGPYLVGMFTGYVLYRTNCKCRINRYVNLFVWLVAAALAMTILYGIYDDVNGHPVSLGVAALYNTVHKTLWGACVCWVIFACATGNGGWVNTLLSWKGFIPLSRLTYCAYLVHPIIMYYILNSVRHLYHFTDLTVIQLFLSNICLSYAAAFIASLAFESPMMGLEKVIFKRGEKRD